MQQKKILILVTRGTIGGAQTSVFNLARVLHEQGERVTVAYGDGGFLERVCANAGIPVHRFRWLRRTYNPFTNIMAAWELRAFLKRERYNVLHINSSNALFAAIGAKTLWHAPKVVFTFRGLSLLDENAPMAWPLRLLYRLVMKTFLLFVDTPVFVSNANYTTARMMGLVRHGHVIHNGLDPRRLSFLARAMARAKLGEMLGVDLSEHFLVGSIGRLASQKNYEFLVEEMAEVSQKHPEVATILIGDGPDRETLRGQISKNGLNKVFFIAGELQGAAQYLKAFDVFVLPSRYEGFSISLLETLFAGVPVLASDVGGAREQFSHAPFQVYPLDEHDAFNERLTRLIRNPNICHELGETNHARSRDFHITNMVQRYVSLYRL